MILIKSAPVSIFKNHLILISKVDARKDLDFDLDFLGVVWFLILQVRARKLKNSPRSKNKKSKIAIIKNHNLQKVGVECEKWAPWSWNRDKEKFDLDLWKNLTKIKSLLD